MTLDPNIEPLSPNPPHHIVRAVMRQTWREVSFLHWGFEAALIRPLVPAGLDLDLYDGTAWVGLAPFLITDLTLPKAPGIPWLSTFPETNVRTYVVDRHGLRGVWFFSLDAARLLAVVGARILYALPYFWAGMKVTRDGNSARYVSARHLGRSGRCEIEVQIGNEITEPGELEVFLTARFRLYAQRRKRLLRADVEHQPWKLRQAVAVKFNESLLQAAGLPVIQAVPLTHFAGTVDVLVGAPEYV